MSFLSVGEMLFSQKKKFKLKLIITSNRNLWWTIAFLIRLCHFSLKKKFVCHFFFLTETYNLFSEKKEWKVLQKPSHSFLMVFFLRFAKTYLLCGKKTKHISYVMSFGTWVFPRVVIQFSETLVSPMRKHEIFFFFLKPENMKLYIYICIILSWITKKKKYHFSLNSFHIWYSTRSYCHVTILL